jgi:hypothetical protein
VVEVGGRAGPQVLSLVERSFAACQRTVSVPVTPGGSGPGGRAARNVVAYPRRTFLD